MQIVIAEHAFCKFISIVSLWCDYYLFVVVFDLFLYSFFLGWCTESGSCQKKRKYYVFCRCNYNELLLTVCIMELHIALMGLHHHAMWQEFQSLQSLQHIKFIIQIWEEKRQNSQLFKILYGKPLILFYSCLRPTYTCTHAHQMEIWNERCALCIIIRHCNSYTKISCILPPYLHFMF